MTNADKILRLCNEIEDIATEIQERTMKDSYYMAQKIINKVLVISAEITAPPKSNGDLIDRGALLKDLRSECPESDICISDVACIECIVIRQPAVNRWIPCSERSPEARRGRWIDNGKDKFICSSCNGYVYRQFGRSDFCPRCGEKMSTSDAKE